MRISISRTICNSGKGYVTVEIEDDASKRIVRGFLTLKDFALAVTGHSHIELRPEPPAD